MKSLRHFTPPLRIFAGADCLDQLDAELRRLSSQRAVIVCGGTLGRGPLVERVCAAAGSRCAGVYTGVRAHSPHPAIEEAAGELRRMSADAVIAVGGGSAVVTARAASIYLAEGSDLDRLSTTRDASGRMHSPKLQAPKLPQIIIPTTPNTATVKAGSAVFDPAASTRRALFDPKTRAQSLFVHPDLLDSAPRDLVVSSTFDTLALALEGLTSLTADPLADAHLMHAVRLIAASDAGEFINTESRFALMYAAILAGQGTDYTGAGVATVLGHAVGAAHDIENGVAKAVVIPHTLAFNAAHSTKGLDAIGAALDVAPNGRSDCDAIVAAVGGLVRRMGAPARLRDLGLAREVLPEIASRAMEDWFLTTNPRPVRSDVELFELLTQAW